MELNETRSVGMSANPISYPDIAEYSRLMGFSMLPWEIGLLRRLDRTALAVTREGQKTKGSDTLRNETPAADGEGVASLLRGFGRTKRARTTSS